MRGNPFVGTARVGWMEFRTHLRSPRLLVLVALFALLVFGASYGLSQSPGGISNQPFLVAHPAIRNESGVDHFLAIGWVADLRGAPRQGMTVSLYGFNLTSPSNQAPRLLQSADTNGTGFVVFDVGTPSREIGYQLRIEPIGLNMVSFFPDLLNQTFTSFVSSSSFSSPFGSESVVTVHVMTLDGYPATGADIYLDDALQGYPDGNGFYGGSLPPGDHTLRIAYKGYEESYMTYGGPSSGPVYENGADAVLVGIVFTFMPLILPIVAIAVSFDAIARERAQGSLELLLARRVRREGILAGKFLGAFASIALPMVVVFLGGIAVLAAVSGRPPTPSFAATVIVASLFLVAVYVLLMLILSTLARSVGTAVVFGVVAWLFFNLFFAFVATFLFLATGGSPASQGFYGALLTVFLLDPNLLYQMMVAAAVPVTSGSPGFGFVPTGYVSIAQLVIAAIVWIVVPWLLATWIFRRKAEG